MARADVPSEHNEQSTFVDYVLWTYQHNPTFRRRLFFSTLNGAALVAGGRNVRKLRREGMTNGVADILYLQPRGPYSYLAIEMKRVDKRNVKDGGLREEQVEFLEQAAEAGACVDTCYGADHAIQVFDEYMKLEVLNDARREDGQGAGPRDGAESEGGPDAGAPDEGQGHSGQPAPDAGGRVRDVEGGGPDHP